MYTQRFAILTGLALLLFFSVHALQPAVGASSNGCQRIAWFTAVGENDGKAGRGHHNMLLVALHSWKKNAPSLEAHIIYGGNTATNAFAVAT